MPPLSLMVKPASGSCNLRCSYCFYIDEMQHRETASHGFMTRDTMEQTIRRALVYAEGSVSFMFQGGEPSLMEAGFYRDWLRLVARYNNRRLPVSYALQTNGYNLSDDLLAALKAGDFLVGVSLDGTRDLHDNRWRTVAGAPTHDQVLQNIQRITSAGIPYNILCVVDDAVAARPGEVYHALRPHGYLQFIPCMTALAEGAVPALDPLAYGRFLVALFDRYEQDLRAGRYVSINLFDNLIRMAKGLPPAACNMQGHCSPNYVVEAGGQVYPCDFYCLDPWLLGNVHTDSFYAIATSDTLQRFLAEGREHPEACRACPAYSLCRTGCKRDQEHGTNRFCAAFRHFHRERGDALTALADVPVTALPRQ